MQRFPRHRNKRDQDTFSSYFSYVLQGHTHFRYNELYVIRGIPASIKPRLELSTNMQGWTLTIYYYNSYYNQVKVILIIIYYGDYRNEIGPTAIRSCVQVHVKKKT